MNEALYDYIHATGRVSALRELRELAKDVLSNGGESIDAVLARIDLLEIDENKTLNEVWGRRLSDAAIEQWLGHPAPS